MSLEKKINKKKFLILSISPCAFLVFVVVVGRNLMSRLKSYIKINKKLVKQHKQNEILETTRIEISNHQ